jgi:hypothetical protein
MESHGGPAESEAARKFVERLKAVRRANAGRAEGELQEALRQALREQLSGLSESEGGRILDEARLSLIGEAEQREARVESLEADLKRLRSEIEALKVERDRLKAAAPAPSAAGGAGDLTAGQARTLEVVRDGLRRVASGEQVDPASLGLAEAQSRLFRLMSSLLKFTLNYEQSVQLLLFAAEVGPRPDTLQRATQKKVIQARFQACLDNKKGSVMALQEALERNSRFLIALNGAYLEAIKRGPRALLSDLEPESIGKTAQRGFGGGLNPEKAWKTFMDIHSEIASLPWEDLWNRFFEAPFKESLGDYLKPAGRTGTDTGA